MPTYSFRCPQCTREFEKSMPFEDSDKPQRCPICHTFTEKQFSPPFIIYGKGWHKPMTWKKPDKTVFYPDGHSVVRDHNTLYEDGLVS